MNRPSKEQCKCGHKEFKKTEAITHDQYQCIRCNRVYVITIRGGKGNNTDQFKPF